VVDDLLARVSLALVVLVRARKLVQAVLAVPRSCEAARVARQLRGAAEALHDAADALELWAEFARFREQRFGRRR